MEPVDFVPHPFPDGIEVEWAGKELDLGKMLESGEIDALTSADAPKCVLAKSPKDARSDFVRISSYEDNGEVTKD